MTFSDHTQMLMPFHLSYSVSDIDAVKLFYTQVLCCSLGRDNRRWFDVVFYGHQLTIHKKVQDDPLIKLDHFGPILDKIAWLNVIEQCKLHHVDFFLQPILKNKGKDNESGKFLIKDPAGNVLEFKFYHKLTVDLELGN